MEPKPTHLGPKYGAQFSDRSVAEAYHNRPPYPPEVFEILRGLVPDECRAVLDLGCGTGEVACALAKWADEVEAVDVSLEMLKIARSRPEAGARGIRWVHSPAESFGFPGPYGLVVASESFHWLDWEIVPPNIARSLSERGWLALVVGREFSDLPWQEALAEEIPNYSTNQDFRQYDLIEELTSRSLFSEHGRVQTSRQRFRQPLEAYVESFHSRNGFSRERMTPTAASDFDEMVRSLVLSHRSDGIVEGHVRASVVWGRPSS